jgi:hypothetical protein
MPAHADIIVSSPDSTEVKLVVEAKLRVPSMEVAESQLKNFMLSMRCPLGLLMSPERLWIYIDRFTSDSEDSIEKLGDFDISELVKFSSFAIADGIAFEIAVQMWLEKLPSIIGPDRPRDPKLRQIINHYLIPAVETGVVRAAGPR